MYKVTLINLVADARSVTAEPSQIQRADVADGELRQLLENFCEIDAVENATADPEIRVQVRAESYLLRTGQKRLVLYDVQNRDLPGHSCTVAEAMTELDGSAAVQRLQATFAAAVSARQAAAAAPSATPPPPARPRGPRLLALTGVTCGLAVALAVLRWPADGDEGLAPFRPVAPAESDGIRAALAGVYLTGVQPGQHGLALTTAGDLKLFELRAVEAPRVVHAAYRLGRVGPALCLATDQPGGRIVQTSPDTLVYCGETYRRVP
jgi:hypothetical protein